MKLETNYCVRVTTDEALKLLTRFVEKKSGKKVVNSSPNEAGFIFELKGEEIDLVDQAKPEGA